MSRGKYSPVLIQKPSGFNCKGETPIEYDVELAKKDPEHYCLASSEFDEDGYDYYGYSCYDHDGNFVGNGEGIDRDGWTEMDYLTLQDIPEQHRNSYYYYNN